MCVCVYLQVVNLGAVPGVIEAGSEVSAAFENLQVCVCVCPVCVCPCVCVCVCDRSGCVCPVCV